VTRVLEINAVLREERDWLEGLRIYEGILLYIEMERFLKILIALNWFRIQSNVGLL
jgi:hypothetical protein